MKFFTHVSLAIAVSVPMFAHAGLPAQGRHDLSRQMYRIESASAFKGDRSDAIDRCNALLGSAANSRARAAAATPEPFFSLGPANMVGDLDAPGGERWYYSAHFDYDEIKHEYFTEYILREYAFDIYDSSLQLVGTVRDKMAYADNEVRVPLCELAPIVTRNFFNTDDKLEVVVGLAVNAEIGVNHYRSLVYQIDGDKTADGYDKVMLTYDELIGDVAQLPSTDGDGSYFFSFVSDYYPSDGEYAELGFWESLCAAKSVIKTYRGAREGGVPEVVFTKDIPLLQLPGDQQNTPMMMSVTDGDDLYFVISHYAEPFYNRYDDPIQEDVSMRAGNSLEVEFWKAGEEAFEHTYTTSIAAPKSANEVVIASYYSIGSMRYQQDINFTGYGTAAGRAALIVTRQDYSPSYGDSYINSYFVYNPDGKLRSTIFEESESTMGLSDLPGYERQQVFVTGSGSGYEFHFVDLVSCKEVLTIDYVYELDDDSDPEILTANMDRCLAGDSYMYVDELRIPAVDENENDIMRFIWIDSKGRFDRIEEVNMGTNVMYAKSYISSDALKPGVYSSSDNMAYMMLVKRGVSGTATEEQLLIGEVINAENPEGKTLLALAPDSRGVLSQIDPFFTDEDPKLVVGYYDQPSALFSQDFYRLPLDQSSGVESAVAPSEGCAIHFDGRTVSAAGTIKVYTATGVQVASGTDNLGLGLLQPGVYVVVATDSALKIHIQ